MFINRRYLSKSLTYILLSIVGLALLGCEPTNTPSEIDANPVPLSVIEDLRLSDTSTLSIVDCVTKIEEYADPTFFEEATQLPSNIIIFIDFADVYMSKNDFDVEVICDNSDYGVYRTLSAFEAPNNGSLWSIQSDQ